jgi:hypothetical protein
LDPSPTSTTPAIGAADVTAMRDYLAAWDGDIRGLLAGGR